MKAIKIVATNEAKLNAALAEAEGKATSRTLDARDLIRVAERAEAVTALSNLRKADHVGATVSYRMPLSLPNAYKYRPDYTAATIERRASGWFLVRASRVAGSLKQSEAFTLALTEAQSAKVLEAVRASYSVKTA